MGRRALERAQGPLEALVRRREIEALGLACGSAALLALGFVTAATRGAPILSL